MTAAQKAKTLKMNARTRMVISGLVAFVFYFAWAYWANMGPTISIDTTLRSALVQGSYSGLVTLIFTWLLELSVRYFSTTKVPSWMKSLRLAKGSQLSGWFLLVVSPLVPLALQTCFVVLVNVVNQTPNLWLTVAPSIVFSGLYGYGYTFGLLKSYSQP